MNVSRITIVLFVAVVIAGGVLALRSFDRADGASAADVLGVDQVAKNPAAFADRDLRVTGVVAAVLPDEHLFTVIDQAEYAKCQVVSCSQYQIPIAYAGDLPEIEAAVTVTGRLTQAEPGRYLFEASDWELPQ